MTYQDLCLKGEEIPNNLTNSFLGSAKTPKAIASQNHNYGVSSLNKGRSKKLGGKGYDSSNNNSNTNSQNNSKNNLNPYQKYNNNNKILKGSSVATKSQLVEEAINPNSETAQNRTIDLINQNDSKYEFYRFRSHIESLKNHTGPTPNVGLNKSLSKSRHSIDSNHSKYSNRTKITKNSVRSTIEPPNDTRNILTAEHKTVLNPKYPSNLLTNKSSQGSLISESMSANNRKKDIYNIQSNNVTSNYYSQYNSNALEDHNKHGPKRSSKYNRTNKSPRNINTHSSNNYTSSYDKNLKHKDQR